MRAISKISVLVSLILLLSFCEKADLTEPQPPDFDSKVFLTVSAEDTLGKVIDSAKVFIDSLGVGHTPLEEEVEFDPGEHSLKVSKKGYLSYQTNFCVNEDNDSLDFPVVLEAVKDTIDNDVKPDSGEVYVSLNVKANIQIKKVKTKSLVVDTLAKEFYTVLEEGIYSLLISKPGYTSFEEGFQVSDSTVKIFNVDLEKLDSDSLWITTNVPEKDTVGGDIGISWETTEGSSVHISPQIGDVSNKGKAVLNFSSTGEKVVTFSVEKDGNELIHRDTINIVSGLLPDLWLEFKIHQDTVEIDQNIRMSWDSNGDYIINSYDDEKRLPSGHLVVTLSETGQRIYDCTVYRDGETVTISDTIVVVEEYQPPLPSISISTSDDTVYVDEDVEILWSSQDAQRTEVDYVSNPGLSGKKNISFSSPDRKVVHASAFNETGSVTDSVIVMVIESLPELYLNFEIEGDTMEVDEDVNMTWNSNGDYTIFDHGIGQKFASGSKIISFLETGTEVITCTVYRNGETVTISDTIVVVESLPELSLDFGVLEDTVEVDDYASLVWESNADYVTFDHGIEDKSASGKTTVSFSETGEEIVTCTAVRGDNSLVKSDTVVVIESSPSLPVFELGVNNSEVKRGSSFRLYWNSDEADSVWINVVSNPGLNGSANLSFNEIGKKVIRGYAYNEAGSVKDSVVIKIVPEDLVFDTNVSVVNKSDSLVYYGAVDASIDTSAYYRIYAKVEYDTSESNESFFVQVVHGTETEIPMDPNLLDMYKIVIDDREIDGKTTRNCGEFWMEKGDNLVDLYHYGQIAGNHPDFVQGSLLYDQVVIKKFIIEWVNY